MKNETDYMNEMLNRNYDCDIDENDLDEEMRGTTIFFSFFSSPYEQNGQASPLTSITTLSNCAFALEVSEKRSNKNRQIIRGINLSMIVTPICSFKRAEFWSQIKTSNLLPVEFHWVYL